MTLEQMTKVGKLNFKMVTSVKKKRRRVEGVNDIYVLANSYSVINHMLRGQHLIIGSRLRSRKSENSCFRGFIMAAGYMMIMGD